MIPLLASLAFASSTDDLANPTRPEREAGLIHELEETFDAKKIRRAKQLRTGGVAAAIAGPPTAALGLGFILAGALGGNPGMVPPGVTLGIVGASATLVGTPLVLGGGAMAGSTVSPEAPRGLALRAVGGTLFGLAIVGTVVSPSLDGVAPMALIGPLYAGAVITSWIGANQAIQAGSDGRSFAIAPTVSPHGAGLTVVVVR
ncbi:MAG: hypothetical protein EA397_14585 [Deltaproteobacteria bacterium]|nr:MAG: hypothetical protein EA397_14585 [Deltaproteobacteria bacterium]